jgi:tRNA (uracil-5-)-methyltransferase
MPPRRLSSTIIDCYNRLSFNQSSTLLMLCFQPNEYDALLQNKVDKVIERFTPFKAPAPDVFHSPKDSFRLRAEFRIWHEADRCFYAMFDPKTKRPVKITQFPIASQRIQQAMPALLDQIHACPLLQRKLYQVEFLSTLSGELLICLIYHKPVDDAWQAQAAKLEQSLNAHIIGRSRGNKRILSQDYVIETLDVEGKTFHYQQFEGSFTQPNGDINQQMLTWAKRHGQDPEQDLLEMYCGNGNFSIALASGFRQVLATELSKRSIEAARYNLELNHIDNLRFVRMSAEDVTQAIDGVRPFRRLPQDIVETYDFSTVLVDPPRAGLDDASCRLIQAYSRILYISCNPQTLAHNLETLIETHSIKAFAVFDQFPYTPHLECAVLLERRI